MTNIDVATIDFEILTDSFGNYITKDITSLKGSYLVFNPIRTREGQVYGFWYWLQDNAYDPDLVCAYFKEYVLGKQE